MKKHRNSLSVWVYTLLYIHFTLDSKTCYLYATNDISAVIRCYLIFIQT